MSATRPYPEPRWFYCHQCTHRWLKSHNSIFECPRCRQGFIEEVTDEFNPNIPFFPSPPSPLRYILYDAFADDNEGNDEELRGRNRSRRGRNENNTNSRQSSRSRSPHISNIVFGTSGNREGNRNDQNFRIIFNTRQGEANRFLSVAIDDIMNSLFTSERQPAMTDEQLNEIPLATITAEQVEAQLQCAICFEDFQLNENEIRKLLCNHFFHEKCIFPWLRNNASCPVCRTSLASENDSDEDVASFVQFITNSRLARLNRATNTDDEPGPSTSADRRSGGSQPSTSNRQNHSRIPIPRPRRESRTANQAISGRIHPRNVQQNPNELTNPRQQTIRREINNRVNSPISSRTRSHNSNINVVGPIERRPLRTRRRNGLSQLSDSQQNPERSTEGQSENNGEQQPRRRRAPFYIPPPHNARSNQRSFYDVSLLRRWGADSSDSSSSLSIDSNQYQVSDNGSFRLELSPSPPVRPRLSSSNGRIPRLRVEISDDSD